MPETPPNLSRRNFLRGKLQECAVPTTTSTPMIITFGTTCMAQRGVMCRTCGDRCDTGAIHFLPQPGGLFPPQLLTEHCTGCGDCLPDCPTQAIRLIPQKK